MRPAPAYSSAYLDEQPLSRRLGGVLVALAITALLILALLTLAPPFDRKPPASSGLSSFGLLPQAAPKPSAAKKATKQKRAQVAKAARAAAPRAKLHVSQVDTSAWPAGMIEMGHEDFAKSDIARIPTHAQSQESASAAGSGSANGGSSGKGQGPGGDQLYNADWYQRPTSAQLGFYIPKTAPPEGWGEIACKTVERYRVEDCHILDESPQGSGFGRAVQESAWQFKVLPPRLGGKPLVGAWVRIRIDYYQKGDALVGSSR